MTAPSALSAPEIAQALGQFPPTEEQRAVIESPPQAPVLVVAGAGSGKTETMAARVVWLVANGHVQPDQVLGLTFTRKAAGELGERIGGRLHRLRAEGLWTPPGGTLAGLGDTPTVSTYHAYAGRLVAEHGMRLGIEPDARMLSEAAAWQYAHDAVTSYDGPMEDLKSAESTITAAVVDLAGELAEHLREVPQVQEYLSALVASLDALPAGGRKRSLGDAKALRETAIAQLAVLPIVQRYQQSKHRRSALDFADQIRLAAVAAQRFPAIGVLERSRFKAVLLDEFQDTSEAQLVLLASVFAAPGEPVPVTAVGDPHQSIYGWRGASATTLNAFRKRFADDGGPARVLPLSRSWRNDHAVLAAANETAAPLTARSAVPVQPLGARDGAGHGSVTAIRHDTVEEEAQAVAAWVAQRWFDHEGRRTGRTAAVLCRKRSQFPLISEALTAAGLPVEVVGVGGLLTTPEVNDLVSLLWVVQDPSRGDRLMRLLVGPAVRLGPADLDGLWAYAREVFAAEQPQIDRSRTELAQDSRDEATLIEALEVLPEQDWRGRGGERISAAALERLHRLGQVLNRLRGVTGLPLSELVGEAERSIGLDIEVLARPEHTPATARVHLDAFADVAAQFASSADRPNLGGFLDWLDAAEREERGLDTGYLEVETDAVQVLTVHASKGLEWDVVAVPGLVEGSFPGHNSSTTWSENPPGWAIGKDGIPDRPDTWRANDKGWAVGVANLAYDLRGDAEGLPQLDWAGAAHFGEIQERFDAYVAEGGAHAVAEERRLAYVAFTRARSQLLLSAALWDSTLKPRVTSRFLTALLESGQAVAGAWAPMPQGPEVENPRLVDKPSMVWPHDPLARRREQLSAGADAVRSAAESLDAGEFGIEETDEVHVLLAERDRLQRRRTPTVSLPRHLSTSALVALAADPEAFARGLRRPLPSEPAPHARRGTAFHAWVEQHYGSAALLDLDEMPGAADESVDESQLSTLIENFLASPWAGLTPIDLEVPIETVVDQMAIRGRIDAVFAGEHPDSYVVVDWKTGRPPNGPRALARAVQLGAYRVAYARLREVPVEQVRAAFFYAATGETVWPQVPQEEDLAALLQTVPD
ncbi:ATP-dependent helicase [Dermacoccaceae bacterium W4C1]